MDKLKQELRDIFIKELDQTDLNSFILTKDTLEVKLNSIIENILNKITIPKPQQINITQTSNDNIFDTTYIDAGKSSEIDLSNKNYVIKPIDTEQSATTIPNNFSLTYDMREFAKSKFLINIDEVFEDFKLYYQSKGTLNKDWEAVWKRWVLNNNKYKSHLIKTAMQENMVFNDSMQRIAKNYISNNKINEEFTKFKNHYLSTGDLKVSWEKVWENWCINQKNFKPKEQTNTQKEKQNYKWNFKKAKEVSDRIKDWLEFEKNIDWLNDFYLKDIPIPGIGWQEVIHPDFNKEEILLFKIDSNDGQFMLEHSSEDILEVEVLEND